MQQELLTGEDREGCRSELGGCHGIQTQEKEINHTRREERKWDGGGRRVDNTAVQVDEKQRAGEVHVREVCYNIT